MRVLATLVIFAVCLGAEPVRANYTGNDLYEWGRSARIVKEGRAEGQNKLNLVHGSSSFRGYVAGVTEWLVTSHALCAPEGMTMGQTEDMVMNFLEKHADWRHWPAAVLVRLAIVDAYSCPPKQ